MSGSRACRFALASLLLVTACGVRSALSGANADRDASMQTPVEVHPETLPVARLRRGYDAQLSATGGIGAPYTFVVVEGAPPPGLSLSSAGVLSGTPTARGTFSFTVRATDGARNSGERAYTFVVDGPRWMAQFLFISTTSTRSGIALVDYTDASKPVHVLNEDHANYATFSPDGLLLSYTNGLGAGAADAFVLDVSGEVPGIPFELLETGTVTHGGSLAWSPDATRITYVQGSGPVKDLWIASVDASGVTSRVQVASDVSPTRDVTWPTQNAIYFFDAMRRPSFVYFIGGAPVRTTFDLPEGAVMALSEDGATALLLDASGTYLLGDVETGDTDPLPAGHTLWEASPTFAALIGRNQSTGAYALHEVMGLDVGPVRATGTITNLFAPISFPHALPLLAQVEQSRIFVTAYGDPVVTRTELSGGYANPSNPVFSFDDTRMAFSASGTVWVSAVNGTRIEAPTTSTTLSGTPRLSFAPSAPLLLAESPAPTTSQLVDLADAARPTVRTIPHALSWTEATWSRDSTHIAFLGGGVTSGRFLKIVDASDPTAEPRIVFSCSSVPSRPLCPGSPTFQP